MDTWMQCTTEQTWTVSIFFTLLILFFVGLLVGFVSGHKRGQRFAAHTYAETLGLFKQMVKDGRSKEVVDFIDQLPTDPR